MPDNNYFRDSVKVIATRKFQCIQLNGYSRDSVKVIATRRRIKRILRIKKDSNKNER